jgi:hypothetical protein
MKRIFLRYNCLALLFLSSFSLLGALDMELTGGVNFMTFHPDRTVAHSTPGNTDTEFSHYPMGLVNFRLSGDINDTVALKINIERDNVLQNSLNVIFLARTDYFRIEFGPFAGVSDNFDTPDAGILGGIELALPGIAALSLSGFTTLGADMDFTSNNYREGLEAGLRLWIPRMIITASAGRKSYSRSIEEEAGTMSRNDALSRLMLNIDFYSKGSPVIVSLKGGYQIYSRIYNLGNIDNKDTVNSYFAGFDLQIEASKSFKLKIGGEIPFLLSAEEPMTVTPEFFNLSKFTAGFVVSLDNKNKW